MIMMLFLHQELLVVVIEKMAKMLTVLMVVKKTKWEQLKFFSMIRGIHCPLHRWRVVIRML